MSESPVRESKGSLERTKSLGHHFRSGRIEIFPIITLERDNIKQEILTTEQKYLDSLDILNNVRVAFEFTLTCQGLLYSPHQKETASIYRYH
jgi:gamma-glutamylcyclotransferase (GGCT)/AIG2-like uncharacterized protein YtfP